MDRSTVDLVEDVFDNVYVDDDNDVDVADEGRSIDVLNERVNLLSYEVDFLLPE